MSDLIEHGASREMRNLIAEYAERGWFDANKAAPWTEVEAAYRSAMALTRPAYLRISSRALVCPLVSVQITERCHQTFRCNRMIVTSPRFDLVDLKIGRRSQFQRADDLVLRTCVGEVTPELFQWPLEICRADDEVSVCARIPEREILGTDDPGEAFEMLLLGEVL
jgi:hypothetical protein